MNVKLFSIFDSKVQSWSSPLPFKHSGDALRWFTERANVQDNNIGKYPSDFTLFEIALFSEVTGLITPLNTPTSLGVAIEFVKTV